MAVSPDFPIAYLCFEKENERDYALNEMRNKNIDCMPLYSKTVNGAINDSYQKHQIKEGIKAKKQIDKAMRKALK